jgi:hypothetical protein
MTVPAIDPPVHLRSDPHRAICSVTDAAEAVKAFIVRNATVEASRVLDRLQQARTPEEAEQAGADFRAWAKRQGLIALPPETR